MKYYLVGIKGTGMSSLACYLHDKGDTVIGSDCSNYYFTEDELVKRKIEIKQYCEDNITNDYIYIIGLSIDKENEEFRKILELDLEYYYYNEFIGTFIDKKIIAVSGTHGKTTTAHIMKEISELSYIIGCGNGKYNNSDYLILEACEYKNHFYSYAPELLVVLNMELDHPDFFKSKKDLLSSFQGMCDRSKKVLINGDDSLTNSLIHPHLYTFGFSDTCDFVIKVIKESSSGYSFLLKGNGLCRLLRCNLVGIHNLYNYVGAYLSCILLELEIKHYINVSLPKRRMSKYIYGKCVLIDDYAHHPTEIKALYTSLKTLYPDYKINCIFQSHTYSRTLQYKKKFKEVLKMFNDVYLLDVFSSAREKEEEILQRKIDRYFRRFKKYHKNVLNEIDKEQYEVWVFLGAGRCNEILEEFKNNHF